MEPAEGADSCWLVNYNRHVATSREPNGHQIRSERSTRLLLKAAGDLVIEGGYQVMTLATIGERAGYSRSLATARFGSKGKLLEALVDEIVEHWSVQVAAVQPEDDGRTGLEILQAFISRIRDSYESDAWSLAVMYALSFEALRPVPDLRPRMVDFHRDLQSQVMSILQKGMEDGSINPELDPEQHAAGIVAQLRGVGYLWMLDPEGIDPVSVLTAYMEQCTQYLSKSPVPEGL